jgi:hypothetical protein
VTSGPLSPTREDLDPEYQPHTEIHRFEMDRCLQMDDQVGLAHASVQLQKAERAEQLLEMGEFDDEGFVVARSAFGVAYIAASGFCRVRRGRRSSDACSRLCSGGPVGGRTE